MPRHRLSYDSSSSEELYTHTQIRRPRHTRHSSVASSHHHHHVHEPPLGAQATFLPQPTYAGPPIYAGQPAYAGPPIYGGQPAYPGPSLAVPVVDVGGRKRASSTSGLPQPNIIINADGGSRSRSRSRERHRPRSRSRGRRFEDDDSIYEEFIERRGRISRSPSPSPYHKHDYETRKALERLKILEDERADKEAQKKYKDEMELKKAKEQVEKAEAEAKRKALDRKAVEDWQREEDAKKARAKKEKEDFEKKMEEHLRAQYTRAGYSPDEIEVLIHKGDEDQKRHVNETRLARARPTHIRVHTQYLLPETLDVYDLPWTYDVSSQSKSSSCLC